MEGVIMGGNVSLVDGHIDEKKQTNYDRIKAMSVEEMAKFIPDWSYTKACKCDEEIYADCNNECWKCVKEYLESDVSE